MRFPSTVAAHRWQSWLLVTALVAVVVTAFLVWDLARNLRTVVISETSRSLENAVKELSQSGIPPATATASTDKTDATLKMISYEILRSYPDVEGGYLQDEAVLGHSFPTYTELGSTLKQPALEHAEVLAALDESRRTGRVAHRIRQDQEDLLVVTVLATPNSRMGAWSLRRILNFSDSSALIKRYLIVAAMIVSLISIGIVLRLGFSLQHGFRVIRSGLQRLEVDLNYRIPDQNHELAKIVQAINTMTENRQKLEAELRREDRLRAMGRVVAGIAHEIRNPLNSIRLTIRVLARRLQDNPGAQSQMEMVTGEIDRLDALLKSLLVFRDGELGALHRQTVLPIVKRSMALVQPHAQERGVIVSLNGSTDGEATVDSDQLQQALMNVLLNAVDVSDRGGVVTVRVEGAPDHIDIAVEDHGPGLSAASQERIFEAFYTTKPGGTGLGLAVTKSVLERMGATIEAANYSNGARFTIQLPRALLS